ncbi:DUF397 domain-containing protein [Streptomyces sp. NPDC002577]
MTSTLRWFKSSYSSSAGGECVEVALEGPGSGPTVVHIRDSKDPERPSLPLNSVAWSAFLTWLP